MIFRYAPSVLHDFPELATGTLQVEGITPTADISAPVARLHAITSERLVGCSETDLPEVQAWRGAFARLTATLQAVLAEAWLDATIVEVQQP